MLSRTADHLFWLSRCRKRAGRVQRTRDPSTTAPSAAARAVKEFQKENEKLKVKAGLLEGMVLGPKAVADQLATLPNKDEARAMLLATFMAPMQTFVRLLAAPATQFAGVLAAKQRKDGG